MTNGWDRRLRFETQIGSWMALGVLQEKCTQSRARSAGAVGRGGEGLFRCWLKADSRPGSSSKPLSAT